MTNKTNKTAAAKTNKAKTNKAATDQVLSLSDRFASVAQQQTESAAMLLAMDVTGWDAATLKKHKDTIGNHDKRAKRAAAFARDMQDADMAATFEGYGLTVEGVTGLAIYAQDKAAIVLRAIAKNQHASTFNAGRHANQTTEACVSELIETGGCEHGALVNAIAKRLHKSAGTASSQASSSRRVLELFGLVEHDAIMRVYRLSERGQEVAELLTLRK